MKVKILIAVLVAVMLLFVVYPRMQTGPGEKISSVFYVDNRTEINATTFPELSLEGYAKVDVNVVSSVIFLSSKCYQFSMVTTNTQTDSIRSGL